MLPLSCVSADVATAVLSHRRPGCFTHQPAKPASAWAIMQILIADDHAEVRRGLREILADAHFGAHFSEAADGDEVLSCLASSEYSLLLLDINMPKRSGLDVLQDVKRDYPQLPVIIVSVQPEDQYARRCLQAGAAAYINKDKAPEELVMATRIILDGGATPDPESQINNQLYANAAPTRFDRLP
jgi:DNA-binding NarL/FixJ family response regulator